MNPLHRAHPRASVSLLGPVSARAVLALLLGAGLAGLSACALPERVVRSASYDFGPDAAAAPAAPLAAPLALAEVDATPALDSTAMLYRLAYADGRESRPYAQSRWTMPPAQLVRQRLRARLGDVRVVVSTGEAPAAQTLRAELEEFSQVFESPQVSGGLVRLRVTLVDAGSPGGSRVRQRTFVAQRPAPTADAAGGVRALADATDAVVAEVVQWLRAAP
jgi:cholesterol transport system auxiliary component